MNKFDWKRLRDCMMDLDHEKVDGYVYEIIKNIIEKEGFKLNEFTFKEMKKIINAGLKRLQNSYDPYDAPDEDINFDDLMLIGIVEILYRKYPEVRERWYDGIWSWEV